MTKGLLRVVSPGSCVLLIFSLTAATSAVAQIQDPDLSAEVTRDTVHVNEDLLPKERTWELIQDPWIDPDDPTVIKLNPDDPLIHDYNKRRDYSTYSDREPGLINVHRYDVHMENVGIPTFFRQPVALTPEDLRAAKVDVAIFGAPMGWMSPAGAGNHWGPMFVRAQFGNGMYGSKTAPLSPIEVETLISPFRVLNVVDYGDAATDPFHLERGLSELRNVTREIAETGAVPLAIGGDHSVPTGTYRGIADVYGYKKVAMVLIAKSLFLALYYWIDRL